MTSYFSKLNKGNDGHVQTVKIRVGENKFTENGSKYLVYSIHKIQLFFRNDEVGFLDGETDDLYNQDDHHEESHVLTVESSEL